MNPFYGERKPERQSQSALLHVSDIMSKGTALVCEGLSMIEFMKVKKDLGYFGPFGVTGISMGGHMASLAACNSQDCLATVPCISPYSAAPVFTKGLLSSWCDWKTLEKQLPDYITPEQRIQGYTARDHMNFLLEQTTNLTLYPSPTQLDATIQVAAKFDCYVPGTGTILHEHWKGSELRWMSYSHVSSVALGRPHFTKAIADAFERIPPQINASP